jgi:hypothetical protein
VAARAVEIVFYSRWLWPHQGSSLLCGLFITTFELKVTRRFEMKKKTKCVRRSAGEPQTNILKLKQFNFSRQWESTIVPHLDDPDVETALTLGLKLHDINYYQGAPPWLCGRGILNGQQATKGSLSWYQPWGRCHHIAPFCWALGQKIFPELKWGFVSGDKHTVVVGWSKDWQQPDLVMDFLFFQERSAQASLDFANRQNGKYYESLSRYVSSFCADPEDTYQQFEEVRKAFGMEPGNERVEFTEMLINMLECSDQAAKSPK